MKRGCATAQCPTVVPGNNRNDGEDDSDDAAVYHGASHYHAEIAEHQPASADSSSSTNDRIAPGGISGTLLT